MKEWIDNILDQYKNEVGECKPPIDPLVLAKLLNTRVVYREGSDHWFGSLMPARKGFMLYVRDDLWEARKRMAICHELGHTYFFDTANDSPRRRDNTKPDSKEENLCFWAARELLAPSLLLEKEFKSKGRRFCYSTKDLHGLAQTFAVSLDTIVMRVSHDLGLLGSDWITLWRSIHDPKQMSLYNEKDRQDPREMLRPTGFYPRHVSKALSQTKKLAIRDALRTSVQRAIIEESPVTIEGLAGVRNKTKFYSRTEAIGGYPFIRAITWVSLDSPMTING